MKSLIAIVITALLLTACSFDAYQCHSYGATNQITKHGHKAQSKYHKRKI